MAEKIIKTKIKLRYDVLSAWKAANPKLESGEVAIVAIPTDSKELNINGTTPPQILFKVGPGNFEELPFASGKAADVYSWAKEASLSIAKDGTGNVVSGIEWDASANDGKGGIKFTTTSVATSTDLEGVKDRLDAIEGDGEKSRITVLEEGLAATNKVIEDNSAVWAKDDNTTYTFEKLTKGFKVTPSAGDAQEFTFDYLTSDEIKDKIEAYGYKNEAGVKAIVESYGYTTVESLNNYYTKTEIDDKIEDLNETIGGIDTAVDGLVERMDAVDGVSGEIASIKGRLDTAEGNITNLTDNKADKTDLKDWELKSDADLVRGRVSTLEGHFGEEGRVTVAEGKISTLEGAVETIMNGTDASKIDSLNDLIEWADEHAPEVASIKEDIEANAAAIEGLKGSKADKTDLDNYYNKDAIDAIDGKVSALEGQISGVDGKLASYETLEAANAVRERVTTVEGKVKTLEETTVPALDNRIKEVEKIKVTSTSVSDGTNTFTKYDDTALANRVTAVENEFKTVTVDGTETKGKVVVLEEKINGVIADYLKGADKTELEGKINNKQDTINDLETIRSGAALGATAVQPDAIADMLTKTEAATTYETKANAAATYETIANVKAVSDRVTEIEEDETILRSTDTIIWDCGGASNN